MKKLLFIIFIIALLSFSVLAVVYSSKEQALSAYNLDKNTADNERSNYQITYPTQKNCKIHFESGKIVCKACFSFYYKGETYNDCFDVGENYTSDEINAIADKVAQHKIMLIQKEDKTYEYVELLKK